MQVTPCRNAYSLLILLFFMACPSVALAIPAITCHCFTDRSYDPAFPTLADPYFLATTQNSFFAAVFAVEKKSIVIKKQQGTGSDDLWVAYWLAAKSGGKPESLLAERKSKGSWQKVVTPLAIPGKSLGGRVAAAVKNHVSDQQLAAAMVDELLLRYRLHGEPALTALRKAGAGNQEMVLAGLLATRIRQPAPQLYLEVKNGKASWGALLARAKIDPAAIEPEVTKLVSAATGSRP